MRPVHDLPSQDPADRSAVRRMLVRGDALRLALGHLDESPEEAPGGVRVPVRAAHGVEEHPLAVEGAVERASAPGDLHVGLVHGPGAAGLAAPEALEIGLPHLMPWAVRRVPVLPSRVAQRSGAGHRTAAAIGVTIADLFTPQAGAGRRLAGHVGERRVFHPQSGLRDRHGKG